MNRITINPQVCHGQACVAGTHPRSACLQYAEDLTEEQVTPIESLG